VKLAIKTEAWLLNFPQEEISTYHTIHGGVYTRTIMIKKGVTISGAAIKVPTTLIFSGNVDILVGDDVLNLRGYKVVPASKDRKQIITANEDTFLTMVFATKATNVEDAENEFTDEADRLISRDPSSKNTYILTGE